MLRIQRLPLGDSVVLAVSGRVDGEAIGELRRALEAEGGRPIVLNLEEMRLVDREGVVALAGFEAAGIRLERCPEFARQWIDAEAESSAGR